MILASKSPRRVQLLSEAGFAFEAVPADIDERAVSAPTPGELVLELAREKASAVERRRAGEGEVVIGSDTVVVLDCRILGKPADAADAARMLRDLSGRSHEVLTGVCAIRDGEELFSFTERAEVEFWDLTERQIEAYVATGEPLDKAGAYGIQGRGRMLVKGIRGDFYNVMGLPVSRLVRELERFGITAE